MVKKAIYAGLICGAAFLLYALGAVAAERQPSFFIPQKVLNRMNQPERLPPIEKMTYGNEAMPTANEMPKQKPVMTPQTAAPKQPAVAPKRTAATPNKTAIPQKTAPKNSSQPKAQTAQIPVAKVDSATATPKNNTPIFSPAAAPKPNTPPQFEKTVAEKPTAEPAKTPPPSPRDTPEYQPLDNSSRTLDDIIADYKRDARGISQGKPVNNPRLRDVLQDYNNERHIL